MLSKALLLLLPAIAYARIEIRVEAGTNAKDTDIRYHGSNVEIISDKERETWQITDSRLKDAAQAYSGGRPQDVFVRSPTPWDDLYLRYKWQQVQRTLSIRSAKVIGITSEPVIVAYKTFVNSLNKPALINAGISQSVEEKVETSWSLGGELTVGQEISYNFNFLVGELGGKTSISYTQGWGKGNTISKSVTVGTEAGISVELEPGESVATTMTATRGHMEVQIDYTANLNGIVACNYPKRYKGHHFWAYDINECLRAANRPRSIDAREVIRIGFYTNVTTTVMGNNSSKKLLAVPTSIIV